MFLLNLNIYNLRTLYIYIIYNNYAYINNNNNNNKI